MIQKGDTVTLTKPVSTRDHNGVLRWWAAGTRFRAMADEHAGEVRAVDDGRGLRTILPTAALTRTEVTSDER